MIHLYLFTILSHNEFYPTFFLIKKWTKNQALGKKPLKVPSYRWKNRKHPLWGLQRKLFFQIICMMTLSTPRLFTGAVFLTQKTIALNIYPKLVFILNAPLLITNFIDKALLWLVAVVLFSIPS
ncbi:MAG: hypothetical protein V3581_00520 [Candidatus Cardinium sp.]|uniref:hypothetical protein n=1 Tax=Candidatus Cardinium sp. TP TaxID=2961955 RepID=UPI0021AEAE63|nr:hypothetical protein [Candidatus Cardinium sp. TP]MCT4696883.1 hypothetical protein [Candidatus Cardinium sp. TP]